MTSFSRKKWIDFLILLFCSITFLPAAISAAGATDQVSRVLSDLMKRPYDKRIRPLYNENPLFVRIGVFLESVSRIDETASELTATLTLRQTWLEPRLSFHRGLVPNDSLLIIPEQSKLLWIPSTIMVNQRKAALIHEGHESTRLISEGQVTTSVRMTVTTECFLHYSYFPFDTQTCDIQLSSYAKDVAYDWDDENSGMKKGIRTAELQLLSYNAQNFARDADPSSKNSSPIFTLVFVRKWHSYYTTFYSPMITFTFVSLLSLWLFDSKIGIIVNFINLPLMNIFLVAGNQLIGRPRTDERTSMDQYSSLCYFFVILCTLVSAADFYFTKSKPEPKQEITPESENEFKMKENGESVEGDVESMHSNQESKPKEEQKTLPKIKAILLKIINIVKILCRHSFWILWVGFLLCNIFYWGSNFSGQKNRIKAIH